MARVQLVLSDRDLIRKQAAALREAGHVVATGNLDPQKVVKRPPQAVILDLAAAPSHARDVGIWMRTRKATREVPLIFVGGSASKLKDVRKHLPDAVYVKTWRGVAGAVKRALKAPLTNPSKPASVLAGYSGTPLPKKLGIKADSVLTLVNAPNGFEKTLGQLPDGVTIRNKATGTADVAIWFTTSRSELEKRVRKMGNLARGLWIAWPKQASGVPTDLTGNVVRQTGLDNGLVDYKVCAIDETWSGLKFARRKT